MTNNVKPITDGYSSVTPYLTIKNAAKPVEFYKKLFAAEAGPHMTAHDGKKRANMAIRQVGRLSALLFILSLSGCGVAAAPCRVGSAVIDTIPLIGHAAATPTDACADVVDP